MATVNASSSISKPDGNPFYDRLSSARSVGLGVAELMPSPRRPASARWGRSLAVKSVGITHGNEEESAVSNGPPTEKDEGRSDVTNQTRCLDFQCVAVNDEYKQSDFLDMRCGVPYMSLGLHMSDYAVVSLGGPPLNDATSFFQDNLNSLLEVHSYSQQLSNDRGNLNDFRKTKIVCTIGPSTSSREMIWKLAESGMNVARLNMSHGDHVSHQKTIDLVNEYNSQFCDKVVAIMLDTKGPEVRSGDIPQLILLEEGQEFNFTIKRGVSTEDTVSVNYDDFVNDVEVGDTLLVDGGMMSLAVKSKTADVVKCVVVDGGELKSRRHLNVRGKSATLPSITDKDWEDIKFGVDNQVDFYAVSFVKDAKVVHELKDYLKKSNADIHVIVKIESADSIPNLHSIISASDGAMVARGDLGAELPIEEVPLLQEDIIRRCHSLQKPVIVATNMLESMIDHPTPTRAEVSDIAIAVREGADAVMLSGETAHGKYPLKAVKVMHTVALRTESSLPTTTSPPVQLAAYKSHMVEMFAFHATTMANTRNTPIIVFTRTGSMAIVLSHYRPSSTIFAFTNDVSIKQRLILYLGVRPIFMQFSDDAEETFSRALKLLVCQGLVKEGEHVTIVQSGAQPIWRQESTHHIQVRKVQA